MKQHISIDQLNELSDKAKEKLKTWWKPEVGDFFITKYSPTYVVYGREDDIDGDGEQLLTDQPVDSGYYGWNVSENFPPHPESESGRLDRYNEVRADALPLLSIGQCIEYLDGHRDEHNNPWWKQFFTWDYGEVNGYDGELIDALWDTVKEDLEK